MQFTSGIVLLGLATTLVGFIAKFGLGERSELFRGAMLEPFDIEREAARWATQACVASKRFKEADTAGSGDLDFDELKTLIRDSFTKSCVDEDVTFNDKEITMMAYHLMRATDERLDDRVLEGHEKTREELKNSKISLHEWQELSTTGVFKRKNLDYTFNLQEK
jgi:hypothetical protein